MAIVLEPKTSYNLISPTESGNNKLLVHVKLTDSCLRALEEYQLVEVSSRRKPSIKFSGFQGSISIPLRKADSGDDNTAEFQLDCSAIQSGGRQGGMDCIQQPSGSKDIRTVGTITHKINVKATDDSYQMTQQRMKEAEEERKGVSTKVINTPKKGSRKSFKNISSYKQQNSVIAAVKRQIRSGTGPKVSSSKTLRERVIHLLAVRPYKKPELISRLTKDGVNLKDRNSLTGILQQVAVMTDNQYRLLKHLYSEVQVETWPNYSETEKQVLRRKMKSEMNDSSLVTSSTSPPKITETNKQTSKRICPSEADRSSKRQRISHIKNNNNIIKHPEDRSSSSVDKSKLSKTSPAESTEVSLPVKQEVESSTTENSINGVNGLDSPEFMRKYKPITTYEQRCLYKKDFQTEYKEYKALKEKLDSVSTKFTDLQSKRLQFPDESTERKEIDKEILELYEKIQKDTLWQQTKKQCHELHTKLSYIKGLIAAYDKSAANT
ncbi:hypothetical protein ACROYT_G000474 [Oculina patagonica]